LRPDSRLLLEFMLSRIRSLKIYKYRHKLILKQ